MATSLHSLFNRSMPRKLRVAIVDDEEAVRTALMRLIRAAGGEVSAYETGKAFLLDALGGKPPDCLILDLQLPPRISALQVLRHLQVLDKRIPTIVITANDEPEWRDACIEAGVSAFLYKPLDDEVLLANITSAVAKGGDFDGTGGISPGGASPCDPLQGGPRSR
jgi:FixJ family two-component response regulator